MAKIWFQALICERFELPGARLKETKGLNLIKLKMQGLDGKQRG
jgi:hypothetical protein